MTVVQIVNVALSLVTLAIKAWAFGDAVIRPSAGFKAVDKMPKAFWITVLGLGAAAQVGWALLVGLEMSWLGLVGLIGIVVALVYIFGIRPQVIQYGGRRGGGGRSSSDGPYGPW
jgi:hypothetical protein